MQVMLSDFVLGKRSVASVQNYELVVQCRTGWKRDKKSLSAEIAELNKTILWWSSYLASAGHSFTIKKVGSPYVKRRLCVCGDY